MTHARRALVVVCALALVASAALAADPCTLLPTIGNAFVGKADKLVDCFTHVPFQASQAQATVTALKSLVNLYSFTDISVNSGAPYHLAIDLRARLSMIENKIKSSQYSSDYAFQKDLMDSFNPLFDAHTMYVAPSGYGCFILRPFNLEASVVTSPSEKMVYTLRQGPLGEGGYNVWKTIFGIDIKPLENMVVNSINGMNPTDQVMAFAENFVSTYKDHGVRFNAALRGSWSQSYLGIFPLTSPHMDYYTNVTLASGQTHIIPNAAFCGAGGIKSTQALLAKNAGTAATSVARDAVDAQTLVERIKTVDRLLVRGVDIHKEQEERFNRMVEDAGISIAGPTKRDVAIATPASTKVQVNNYSDMKKVFGKEFHTLNRNLVQSTRYPADFDASHLTVVSSSTSGDTVFMIYDDKKSPVHYVLKLATFAPADEKETLAVIQAMIKSAQTNKVENLIMDVAYNGGGIICLSDLLLALLVPNWGSLNPGAAGPTLPYGIYDFRQSVTSDALRANSYLDDLFTSYTNYLDMTNEKPYTNSSFFKPINRVRSGLTSSYTQQAYFPAQCVGYPGNHFVPIQYYFKHIVVLTDGTCGSACALFASQLQSYNYAKVVSYGGPLNRHIPLSTASFAGGNVLPYETVAAYAGFFGGGAKNLPPSFTSTATARFNFNEYYEFNDLQTPREFLKRPADVHLDFYATLFNDDVHTPLGLANSAGLYSIVSGLKF